MGIKYTYKKYEGYEEATNISYRREGMKVHAMGLCTFCFVFSIIAMCVDISKAWGFIFVTLASALWFVYLITKYDKVTENKIARAISKQEKEQYELKKYIETSKYTCKEIKVCDKHSSGICAKCQQKNEVLTLCKVKNNIGVREIYICDNCIGKYQKL